MPRARPDLHERRRRAPSSRALLVATCAGAVVGTAAVWLRPAGPAEVAAGLLAVVAPALAVVLCLRAARRVPAERYAWWATAVAWSLNIAGDVVHAVAVGPREDSPFPSVADAFWLACFPALFLAPVLLLRARVTRPRASTWLDGLVGALGVTAVAATAVIGPALPVPDGGVAAAVATFAHPLADLLLLALVGAVLAVVGLRGDVVVGAVCLVLALKFAGDLLLASAHAAGDHTITGPQALVWSLNACLTAAAAHLTSPRRHAPARDDRPLRWQALLIPLLCTVAALVVLAVQWRVPGTTVAEVCALGCVAAFLARTTLGFLETRALHDAHRQAHSDDLTGLPNRRALVHRLEHRLAAGRPTALLLLDLDGFKAVNDGLGHAAGDDLLRRLGERLRPALRPTDLLARLGGDEFAVVLHTDDPAVVTACAERLADLTRRPLDVAGTRLQVGASVGVATSPAHATDASGLLRCADTAMYAAKGRDGGVRWYAPAAPLVPAPRQAGTAPPPGAAPHAGASPHFGAALRFRAVTDPDGAVVVAEALAADAPARPDRLAEALEAAAGWWDDHPVPVQVSIGPADLAVPRLADALAAALLRAGLPPAALLVRLTAEAAAEGDGVPALLAGLRARGLRSLAEATGTGALALTRLGDLPVDRVRLDPQLARDALRERRASLVVGHTVALAAALGVEVVTDAVDDDTDAVLTRLGCRVLRPAPAALTAAAFRDRLDRRAAPVAPGADG